MEKRKETMGKAAGRFTAVLAALSLLACGCGRQVRLSGTGEENGQEALLGRYVEEYTPADIPLGRCTAPVRLDDGRIAVFSYNYGPFVTGDEGKSWELWQNQWYGTKDPYMGFRCAAIAPDGTLFLGGMDYSEDAGTGEPSSLEEEESREEETQSAKEPESPTEGESMEETGEEGEADGWDMEYQLIHPDGSAEDVEIRALNGRGNHFSMNGCWYAPDGVLYVTDMERMYEWSKEGLTALFDTDAWVQQVAFAGDNLFAVTSEGVLVYDRREGVLRESDAVLDKMIQRIAGENGQLVRFASDAYSIYLYAGEQDTLYLTCGEGIYRHTLGGGTMEKLLEGSLCSLGDPSTPMFGMLPLTDNRFFVLYGDGSGIFAYDESMPAQPDRELQVYSLEKDVMAQKVVSMFQRRHPELYVNYEIGWDGEGGQTKEDAVKNLNTRILAGNGPDVLFLDGLPMDAYTEKGMLADLSKTLERAGETEPLFGNIAGAFEEGGKVFAVPARCKFPCLLGPAEEMGKIADIEGMADAVESLRMRQETGSVSGTMEALPTLELLASSCAPAWEGEENGVDMAAVEAFYTQALRIYEAEKKGISQEEKEAWKDTNYGIDGARKESPWMLIDRNAITAYFQDKDSFAMGYANEMWGLQVMFSVCRQRKELSCDVMPGQAQHVFYPYTIAGISALAKEEELAQQFVELLLTQEAACGEGFFVNRAAMEESATLNSGDENGVIGSMSMTGTSRQVMELYQLTQEEMAWMYGTLEALQTPYLQNERLESAVLETGEKLLNGEIGMQEALAEVEGRVKLSLAE